MITNSQATLRHICKRILGLEEQKDEITDEIKEARARAKSDGFDPALITKTVKMMRLDEEKRKKALDQMSLFDTYLSAVGVLAVLDEGDGASPETHGEQDGLAGSAPDQSVIQAGDKAASDYMRGWERGNRARLAKAAEVSA